MLKTISKALSVLTLAGLMLWSPLPLAQAASTTSYYISAETDYNANEPIYVVGHKEPDTDTVCSAIAYARLLQALNYNAKAVLPGKLVDMYFMMLTNLDSFSTKLLCFGDNSLATAQKAFGQESDAIILPGAVSRKKQIVPPLQKALQ